MAGRSKGWAEDSSKAVQIKGLTQLRSDLRRMDKELDRQVGLYIRQLGPELQAAARVNTPRRSGRLRRSIRYSVTRTQASLYSKVPYAPVHEFGGTIKPKGAPIKIKGSRMLSTAVEANTDRIEKHMWGLFDHLANRTGWH